jgi:mediator of RNA polymerase II transcription subunit 14
VPGPASVFGPLQSTLSHAIPALLIQSSDVLHDSAARDAAMPNIRVVPLTWWAPGAVARAKGGLKGVTCVKLCHVQQLVGRRIASASSSLSQGVLRPSRRIMYEAREALVCFLSDEVDWCMDEFKKWESLSMIVVIAREVTSFDFLATPFFAYHRMRLLVINMAKEKKQWKDVRLISFDLQTVEFTYASVRHDIVIYHLLLQY